MQVATSRLCDIDELHSLAFATSVSRALGSVFQSKKEVGSLIFKSKKE